MANHGLVTVAETLPEAYNIADIVEYLSLVYLQVRSAGQPQLLTKDDMTQLMDKFNSYGN
jgi:L-fuculose-phosphate aldolase